MSTITQLIARRNALLTALARTRQTLTTAPESEVLALQNTIAELQAELATVEQQITQLQGAVVSTGVVVRDDQLATVSGASPQNPVNAVQTIDPATGRIVPLPDTTSPTNAVRAVTDTSFDFGLDDPVRTVNNTQAVVPGTENIGQQATLFFTGTPGIVASGAVVTGGGQEGYASGRDDTALPETNATRAEIDTIFNETQIVPLPNVLDQYASYNYVASVYLMSPQSYNRMIRSKQKSLNGAQLLFQSGGASVQGRNEYFSNDYYIERVMLKSKILGKGTGAPHNVVEMSMTVVEPNGITLIDNLNKAVQSFLGGRDQKQRGFTQPIYLLVMRFYGYDDQGNLVRGGVPRPDGSSDANAFVEKFYPFVLSNVGFRITNRLVEYNLECKPVINMVNYSSSRGSIPYNIELAGQTLKDLLSGPAVYANNQSEVSGAPDPNQNPNANQPGTAPQTPQKAGSAPTAKKTIRQGLMAAMNDFQQQLKEQGDINVPDIYEVEFLNDSLANARITKKGTTVKKSTPMSSGGSAANQKLPNKQSTDNNSRIVAATAGMQIVQFLDQAIKNSSYLEDQQLVIVDEETGEEYINGKPAQNVAWYKVSFRTEQLEWDDKRNDYAYRITYVIQAYRINQLLSKYFPIPGFKGVHKQYKYWFTGENTSVLNYEENLNTLYKVVLSGGINNQLVSTANAELKYAPQPRSGESSQGAQGKTTEAAANAAESLYSPSDLKECTMTIVGDPAWLQQGEAFAGFFANDATAFRSFLPDGTINVDSQQPMFEVAFNTPKDYNLETGLVEADPVSQFSMITQQPTTAQISRLYIARECTSYFDRGKFTQQLQGILYLYDPQKVAQANQQIATSISQVAIQALSRNRQLNSAVSGVLKTPAFASLLPGVTAVLNSNTNYGQNVSNQPFGTLNNSVLGGVGLRTSPAPGNPTSFGLAVGTPNLNTPSLATPTFVESGSAPPTTNAATQVMAASDDEVGVFTPATDSNQNDFFG